MGVLAFTAGSFGDFVAVLQLAWAIRRVLSDATQAPKEVRELIDDIDSFTHMLQTTKATLEQLDAELAPSVTNGFNHALSICFAVLSQTNDKLRVYEVSFARKHGIKKWTHGLWSAYVWVALGGRSEVDALKGRLNTQVTIIQTLMGALNMSSLARVEKSSKDQRVRLDRLLDHAAGFPQGMTFDLSSVSFKFYDQHGNVYQPIAIVSFSIFKLFFEQRSTQTSVELDYLRRALQYYEPQPDPDGFLVSQHSIILSPTNTTWTPYETVAELKFTIFRDPRVFDAVHVVLSPIFIRTRGALALGSFVSPELSLAAHTAFALCARLDAALRSPDLWAPMLYDLRCALLDFAAPESAAEWTVLRSRRAASLWDMADFLRALCIGTAREALEELLWSFYQCGPAGAVSQDAARGLQGRTAHRLRRVLENATFSLWLYLNEACGYPALSRRTGRLNWVHCPHVFVRNKDGSARHCDRCLQLAQLQSHAPV